MKSSAAARVDLRVRGSLSGERLRYGITIEIMIMIMIMIKIMIETKIEIEIEIENRLT